MVVSKVIFLFDYDNILLSLLFIFFAHVLCEQVASILCEITLFSKYGVFTASAIADIGGRLRKDSCYKIVDGPFESNKYIWYQLTHRCWNEVQYIL